MRTEEFHRIRLSEPDKNRVALLKRRTGIKSANVVLRWALCVSLADEKPPSSVLLNSGAPSSNVELRWETFAGRGDEALYDSLLVEICQSDPEDLADTFYRHLRRGLGILLTKVQSAKDLLARQYRTGRVVAVETKVEDLP